MNGLRANEQLIHLIKSFHKNNNRTRASAHTVNANKGKKGKHTREHTCIHKHARTHLHERAYAHTHAQGPREPSRDSVTVTKPALGLMKTGQHSEVVELSSLDKEQSNET